MLDQNSVGIGIKISERLPFRNPAAENLVGNRELARLIVLFEDNVFSEILQRNFRAESGAEIPDFIRPFFEFRVMRHASFQRDRIILGSTWGLAGSARISSLAVLHYLGGAFKRADLTDTGHIPAIPFNPKFEILVRVESLRVDCEFGHVSLLLLDLNLASYLLDFNDNELGRLQGCESHKDINHAAFNIVLSGGFAVAFDEIGLLRTGTLKRAPNKQIVHKGPDVEPDLGPKTLIIGFENDPLCAAVKALLDIERRAAY